MIPVRVLVFTISPILIVFSLSACKPKLELNQQTQTPPQKTTTEKQDTDFQAAFAIFTDDIARVFTASMYHNQSNDAFITSEAPNTINVKKTPVTWGDFFNSLPMQLTNECLWTGTLDNLCTNETKTLKFYVNGQKVEDFINLQIKSNDHALISYGNQSESQILNQIKQIPSLKQ